MHKEVQKSKEKQNAIFERLSRANDRCFRKLKARWVKSRDDEMDPDVLAVRKQIEKVYRGGGGQ